MADLIIILFLAFMISFTGALSAIAFVLYLFVTVQDVRIKPPQAKVRRRKVKKGGPVKLSEAVTKVLAADAVKC